MWADLVSTVLFSVLKALRCFLLHFDATTKKCRGKTSMKEYSLECIFVNKINTYRLKRWQYRPRAKLSIVSRMLRVFKNIQWWHLVFVYIYIYFYYVGKICTNITPTNLRAKWEDCRKAWNYITIDFHWEMGQEYSKIVQKWLRDAR